ncbi:DUF2127 domain-containing protein [Candidatus Gottesmanbacteria bacterium]|nr:DUF2127 domain-containing protein [Candidatus Gottesmanbacteria bacterium]
MKYFAIEKEFHVSWYIIAYKLLFGLAEFLLGAGITFFGRAVFHWYRIYAAQELSEDPHDLLVRLTEGIIPNVLAHHAFFALYLTLLGSIKIAGAIGLIYKQNWGVDLLVGLTLLMLPFQLFQLARNPSITVFLYILIGLLIAMYLVNFRPHEWAARMATKVKRHHSKLILDDLQ